MFVKILLRQWWKMSFFVAITAIVMLWINIFVFHATNRTSIWKEEFMLPFYFTYISNLFALVISYIKGFTHLGKTREIKVAEIMGFANLFITFLVYWGVLFPTHIPNTAAGWATNMLVHLIVPAIYILLFFVQNIKNSERHYFNPIKNPLFHLIFLVIYSIVAIIVYFALGAEKEDAVYSFVALLQNPWWLTFAMIFGLFMIYYLFTLWAYLLINKYSKKIDTQ